MLIASNFFMVGIYRKAVDSKYEENKTIVAWSDQEPDKDSGNNGVEIAQDSRDVLANSDGQNALSDTLSVAFDDLRYRRLTFVFQIY